MNYTKIGKTDVQIPELIFGTTVFGNIFQVYSDERKLAVLQALLAAYDGTLALDSAGKYGAGLALEFIGRGLTKLDVDPQNVVISNKLAWRRSPLVTAEPTFEPGAWFGLQHDAVQDISYDGILRCWEEGEALLGARYSAQLLSVHDPDEYLAAATSNAERSIRLDDILGAYRALEELRSAGKVSAIGIGAKDWKSIFEIAQAVDLDWVMFANSMTLYSHPPELLAFMDELRNKQVAVVNSALFNAGFLTGGAYFNYRRLDPTNVEDQRLFEWRERFFALCKQHAVAPATACIQFGKSHPAVVSIALSTSRPERVRENIEMLNSRIPSAFWHACKENGLLAHDYPFL